MYSEIDFKTKKALKEAVSLKQEIRIFQPGGFFNPPENSRDFTGIAYLEGPHYPKPHTWYATAKVENGLVISVK